MYVKNYFNVKSHFHMITRLGIILFILFPYIYVLNTSLKGKYFIDNFAAALLTVFILFVEVKKIILYSHDILWIGPVLAVILSSRGRNPLAITYGVLFTMGIASIVLIREKYSELEFGLCIMQLLAILTAISVIVSKLIPNFWINLVGGYYRAGSLERMSNEIAGSYCNGIFYSVACTAGFLVNGFAVSLFHKKKIGF